MVCEKQTAAATRTTMKKNDKGKDTNRDIKETKRR